MGHLCGKSRLAASSEPDHRGIGPHCWLAPETSYIRNGAAAGGSLTGLWDIASRTKYFRDRRDAMTFSLRHLLLGASAAWLVVTVACSMKTARLHKRADGKLDEALDETFPASDPTATQDFAIPANRAVPQT
jgi:hypothetical protein